MKRTAERTANEASALKPIGLTMAAVVAGLGAGGRAQAEQLRVDERPEPTPSAREHYVDPTNDPRFEEEIVLGPSEPMEPLAVKAAQSDLFDPDVPLGRTQR